MGDVISALKGVLTNDLEIEWSLDQVTVKWNGGAKVIHPIVHVSLEGKSPQVIGVDASFGAYERSCQVQLFGPLPPSITSAAWRECLAGC
jgi:hypothetical protein